MPTIAMIAQPLPTLADRIDGMARGDPAALDALFDRMAPTALGLATWICRGSATAEAVVETAFGEAWRTASGFRSSDTLPEVWFLAIVRRHALAAEAMRPSDGPQEPVDWVRTAFSECSAAELAMLAGTYFEGRTCDEAADALGIPREASRALLGSALRGGLARHER